MNYTSFFKSSKFITVILLLIGTTFINVSGQGDAKDKFSFNDRFISSGGVFQPLISNSRHNYYGLSFSPRLNLLNNYSDFSIAFGSQLDFGYKLSSTDANSKLMASIPAIVTLNAGHLASKDFYSYFGIFAGGGYDFCIIEEENKKGFVWTSGVRFWFLKKSFTLRYSQLQLNDNIIIRIFSLELDFGAYIKKVYRNNQISRFVKPMQ